MVSGFICPIPIRLEATKRSESVDLKDFTPKEHRLIYSLAGADLLDSSTTRALVMLYAKETLGDIV